MYIVFEGENLEQRDSVAATVASAFKQILKLEVVDVRDSQIRHSWSARAEARGDMIDRTIRPALDRGAIVVSCGSFISDLVEGAMQRNMEGVWDYNKYRVGGVVPDLVVCLGGSEIYQHAIGRVFNEFFKCHEINSRVLIVNEGSDFDKTIEAFDYIKPRIEGSTSRERVRV